MTGWAIVPAALALDALLGDPRALPHPVRAMGAFASWIEARLRPRLDPFAAGVIGWLFVVGTAAAFAAALPWFSGAAAFFAVSAFGGAVNLDPRKLSEAANAARFVASRFAMIWLVYVSIAPRDLAAHALRVARALRDSTGAPKAGLAEARGAVSMIVGRDVERLDRDGIVRAAIESVAESCVDGVCAPIFWTLLLGPVGAFAYRAANTLDSMWGHKDERYLLYGRVAARADDALNWLPARMAFFCSVAAAGLFGLADRLLALASRVSARAALRCGWRDRRKHESPNAAWLEASFAGALGISLGGAAWYGGRLLDKPLLGEARRPCETADIGRAVTLMYATTLVFAGLGVLLLSLAGTSPL